MVTISKDKICNKQGEKESFDERKLYSSIYHPAMECGYPEDEAQELANDVCDEIIGWIENHDDNFVTSDEIRAKVIEILEDKDDRVAFLYDKFLDIN
ncbi:MAG: hypothetical protein SVV03_03150 [Candidatus Nanohaloarchaea archaeon]|nr:hypothetical protein [Candidatus Nanohaloarchaea archaeon]